jgi:hypothetical protein
MSAQGVAVHHLLGDAGGLDAEDAAERAGIDADEDGVERQRLHQLHGRGAGEAGAALHQHGGGHQHHRQVDGDEQEQRHRPLRPIGLQDERHAHEHRIGLPRREAVDHRLLRAAAEQLARRQHGEAEGEEGAGEIGDPVAPGLGLRQA